MNKEFANYRSTVFSVLKTGFGWVGLCPAGLTDEKINEGLNFHFYEHHAPVIAAQALADAIHYHGGEKMWGRRIDGKPNTYLAKGATPHETIKKPRQRRTHSEVVIKELSALEKQVQGFRAKIERDLKEVERLEYFNVTEIFKHKSQIFGYELAEFVLRYRINEIEQGAEV